MPDLELDALQRSVDLARYARSMGYEDRPRDNISGVTVLEHSRSHDRIAVAQFAQGGIYARITDYHPRGPDESDDRARLRLRDCIARSPETGTVVDWVQHREREAGRPDLTPGQLREYLRTWQQVQRALEPAGPGLRISPHQPLDRRLVDWVPAPSPSSSSEFQVPDRIRRWEETQRALDLKLAQAKGVPAFRSAPQDTPREIWPPTQQSLSKAIAGSGPHGRDGARSAQNELSKRRYDWSAPVGIDAGAPARRRTGPERER
jgi:hypothetical protein